TPWLMPMYLKMTPVWGALSQVRCNSCHSVSGWHLPLLSQPFLSAIYRNLIKPLLPMPCTTPLSPWAASHFYRRSLSGPCARTMAIMSAVAQCNLIRWNKQSSDIMRVTINKSLTNQYFLLLALPLFLLLLSSLSSCDTGKIGYKPDAIVGGDSPNAFTSIQDALDAAPADQTQPYRILVSAGRYKEKLYITRANTEIRGEGADKTVIYFDAYAGNSQDYRDDAWGTPGSATVSINTANVHMSDLTIENTFDFLSNDARTDADKIKESQAVALLLDTNSDKLSFTRVTLNGYQDTLFANGDRAYFYQSTISGNIDFIFGKGNVVFDQSTIVSRPRNSH